MKGFNITKLIISLVLGIAIAFGAAYLFGFSKNILIDCLSVVGCITLLASFTFIQTILGHYSSLSGSSQGFMYHRIKSNLDTYEKKKINLELFLAGMIELGIVIFLIIL